jgi:hypothetical protein
MSSHKKHKGHINHSKKDKNKKGTFDINTIADLLNNIKPEDISTLVSTLNLGGFKAANKNEEIQNGETISEPVQTENKNNSSSDTTLDFLTALKPLVSYERGQILDKIMQIYSVGNILKK